MTEISQNKNILLTEKELRYLLTLAKDRKLKLEIGKLNYSDNYIKFEKNENEKVLNKLKDCLS